MFKDAIRAAVAYKDDSTDFMDEIMRELEVCNVNIKSWDCCHVPWWEYLWTVCVENKQDLIQVFSLRSWKNW